jgi:hypothetical protein
VIGNLRSEINERLADGESLVDIDDGVLEHHGELSEDERSALWLYAWLHAPERESMLDERELAPVG